MNCMGERSCLGLDETQLLYLYSTGETGHMNHQDAWLLGHVVSLLAQEQEMGLGNIS